MLATAVEVTWKPFVSPLPGNRRPGTLSLEGTGTDPDISKKAGSDLPPPGGGRKPPAEPEKD